MISQKTVKIVYNKTFKLITLEKTFQWVIYSWHKLLREYKKYEVFVWEFVVHSIYGHTIQKRLTVKDYNGTKMDVKKSIMEEY